MNMRNIASGLLGLGTCRNITDEEFKSLQLDEANVGVEQAIAVIKSFLAKEIGKDIDITFFYSNERKMIFMVSSKELTKSVIDKLSGFLSRGSEEYIPIVFDSDHIISKKGKTAVPAY